MEEEDDNVQNINDDERGLEWDAEHDGDGDEEEMFLSSKSPAERSGHIAVTDGTCMFVWGGYKVSHTHITFTCREI